MDAPGRHGRSLAMTLRLNLGCGRRVLDGWVNVDAVALPGVDVVADLDRCRDVPLPFDDGGVEAFHLSHVIEHLRDPLGLMQELHRIARPGATAEIRCPHGANDDADEDPTHVRRMFPQSFGYFSQPYYWRADYGYRGDWQATRIELFVDRAVHEGTPVDTILERIRRERNHVIEMVAWLVAVKPIRPPDAALRDLPPVTILWAP